MAEAVQNMLEHRARSVAVDRSGWTDEEWIADARRLMDDLHGSVQSLVNGHVLALLRAESRLTLAREHLPELLRGYAATPIQQYQNADTSASAFWVQVDHAASRSGQ